MKSFSLTSFFCLVISTLSAQNLKTYEGAFNYGVAKYQYYENSNFERIYEGSFKYTLGNFTIEGQFKNNKRNGVWKATKLSGSSLFMDEGVGFSKETPYKFIQTATYIDGNLNGTCTFTEENIIKKQILCKEVAFFKNNILINAYSLDANKNGDRLITVNSTFNTDGYVDGVCKRIYKGVSGMIYEEIGNYENGFLLNMVVRNFSTGEIIKKVDNQEFLKLFKSHYDSISKVSLIPRTMLAVSEDDKKDSVFMKGKTPYTITYGAFNTRWQVGENGNSLFFSERDNGLSYNKYQNEDLLVSKFNNGANLSTSMGFKLISINDSINEIIVAKEDDKKEEYIKNERIFNELVQRADRASDSNFALKNYEAALKYKDDSSIKEKIEKIKLELINQEQIKIKKNEDAFSNFIQQAEQNKNSKNYIGALSDLEKAQKIKNDAGVQNQINSIKEIIVTEKIKQADSLMIVRKFFDGLRLINQAEQYSTQNTSETLKSKKTIISELNDLRNKVYDSRYENIIYHIGRGGAFDKNALDNYKALLKSSDEIQDIELYKQRLKCLATINYDIFNRLLGDPEGISKDLKKSQKFLDRVCK